MACGWRPCSRAMIRKARLLRQMKKRAQVLRPAGGGAHTLSLEPWVSFAMIECRIPLLSSLCLLLASPWVWAGDPEIHWPSGWQVEEVVPDGAAPATPQPVSRQRAIKNDENGNTLMVMELTGTPIEAGHNVNLQGVLLEMRKSIQKDFAQGGYQSVCSKMHSTTLSRLEAVETTCMITENGRHVLSQTLVGAVDTEKAYVFSYAGQADAYEASKDEVSSVRASLKL